MHHFFITCFQAAYFRETQLILNAHELISRSLHQVKDLQNTLTAHFIFVMLHPWSKEFPEIIRDLNIATTYVIRPFQVVCRHDFRIANVECLSLRVGNWCYRIWQLSWPHSKHATCAAYVTNYKMTSGLFHSRPFLPL